MVKTEDSKKIRKNLEKIQKPDKIPEKKIFRLKFLPFEESAENRRFLKFDFMKNAVLFRGKMACRKPLSQLSPLSLQSN